MKLNWGTGLTAFIIFFLVTTIGVVVYLMTIDVNLVTPDYYEQEIKYQQHIDKIERTHKLAEQPNISISGKSVVVSFPQLFNYKNIKGEVLLFRPSDKNFDIKLQLNLDSNYTQSISSPKLVKGMWKAKIDWSVGDTLYYNEEIVMIN